MVLCRTKRSEETCPGGADEVTNCMEGVTFFYEWEVALMEAVQGGMGSAMTLLMSAFTFFGEEMIAIAILAFLYWVWDKEAAVFVGTNVLVGTVCNPFLKNFALRRRPYFDHPSIQCLKPVHAGDLYDISAQGYSFPSGHSSNVVILTLSLARVHRYVKRIVSGNAVLAEDNGRKEAQEKQQRGVQANINLPGGILYTRPQIWTAVAGFLPLAVGFSRVALGVHYPTDVLAGWASGVLVVLVMSYLQRTVKHQERLYLVLAVCFLPGFFICKTNDFFTCYGILCGFFAARILDERVIRFESTRNVRAAVLRLAIGFALFGILNVALKLPFSDEFLHSATTGQFLFRTVRYFLISFVMLGLYPAAFRKVRWLS